MGNRVPISFAFNKDESGSDDESGCKGKTFLFEDNIRRESDVINKQHCFWRSPYQTGCVLVMLRAGAEVGLVRRRRFLRRRLPWKHQRLLRRRHAKGGDLPVVVWAALRVTRDVIRRLAFDVDDVKPRLQHA